LAKESQSVISFASSIRGPDSNGRVYAFSLLLAGKGFEHQHLQLSCEPKYAAVKYFPISVFTDWITSSAPLNRVDLAKVIDQGSEERSRVMIIIGCDFHSRFQQIAMLDATTGEVITNNCQFCQPTFAITSSTFPLG
jgi:hypothetical protein